MQRTPFGQKLDEIRYYDWISFRKTIAALQTNLNINLTTN